VTEGTTELALVDDEAAAAPDQAVSSAAAFRFVEKLAAVLSGGELELPFLPDVAIRVRALMDDPDCSIQKLGKALSTEPALVARLTRMANSAMPSRTGNQVTEITAAVSRLGFELVRNASWTYALAQMQRQNELQPVADQLAGLWREATDVAALAFVVARETNTGQPDEALMAGMTHNVGAVYILSRLVTWDETAIPATPSPASSPSGARRLPGRSPSTGSSRRPSSRRSPATGMVTGTASDMPTCVTC
jgi:hypothetical protein